MSTDIYKLQEMGLDSTCLSCRGTISSDTQERLPTT